MDTDVINQSLVDDPTAVPPGFSLPRHLWANLNHFRTGQGQCAANLARWRKIPDPSCSCGAVKQTMSHIVICERLPSIKISWRSCMGSSNPGHTPFRTIFSGYAGNMPVKREVAVSLTVLAVLAFNAHTFTVMWAWRRPFSKNVKVVMYGLSLGTCLPNGKSAALTSLELLAFLTPKNVGLTWPLWPPFSKKLRSHIGGKNVWWPIHAHFCYQ